MPLSRINTITATDNANAALRITQLGTGNALLVEDSTNPDSSPTVIDANGRVVVGATSPITAAGTLTPFIESVQTSQNGGYLAGTYVANAGGPNLIFVKTRGTSVGDNAVVSSGDNLGVARFQGGDGTSLIEAASITGQVDGTPGTSDMPGRLVFSTTADGASTPTERMRIDSAGNVGINATPASTTKLRIGGGDAATTFGVYNDFQFTAAIGTGYSYTTALRTAAGALTTAVHYNASQSTFTGTVGNQFGFVADSSLIGATNNYGFYGNIASGTGRWNFYAAGTAQNYFAGNVGIGVTAPTAALQVSSGEIIITSAAKLGYGTGSGGTVTQATSKSTGVTLDKPTGQITMNNASLAAAAEVSFTLTNSVIAATDVVVVSIASGATAGAYSVQCDATAAGSCRIGVGNRSTGSLSEALVLNFVVIKGATN
jgi:hypothetical protein